MITLITGTPGSGKSAFALLQMLDILKDERPLFVHGVPNLTLPHHLVKCNSLTCDYCNSVNWSGEYLINTAENWHEWSPDGAVLFFDEVQHIYRPRASGAKVPESVAAFETHRHRGLDFYLITQSPKLIDINIRQLIGRHIHLKSTWLTRFKYEWPECSDNVQNVTDAVKSKYELPKKVFKYYKSASIHTKQKHEKPISFYMFFLAIFVFLALGYRVKVKMDAAELQAKQALEIQSKEEEKLKGNGDSSPIIPASLPDTIEAKKSDKTAIAAKFDYNPVVPNVPESAPAYEELVKPISFPKLSGCVVKSGNDNKSSCRCYTQQATPYFVSNDMCLTYIKYGRFNPYLSDSEKKSGVGGQGTVSARSDGDGTQATRAAPIVRTIDSGQTFSSSSSPQSSPDT